jgi:hypothetical protein
MGGRRGWWVGGVAGWCGVSGRWDEVARRGGEGAEINFAKKYTQYLGTYDCISLFTS